MEHESIIPKKEIINLIVWDCGFGHKHRTECAAKQCIKKNTLKVKPKPHPRMRGMQATLNYLNGMSIKQAAESVGRKSFSMCEVSMNLTFAMTLAQFTGFFEYQGSVIGDDLMNLDDSVKKSIVEYWIKSKGE